MAAWAAKRFWTQAAVAPAPGGHAITLDGRPARTPAKAPLVLPTRALAQAVADEWQAVQGPVNPARMPLTRIANTAIDAIPPHRQAVIDELAGYGATDLLCYRAASPAALVARQSAAWDPLLDWAAGQGAPLVATAGVIAIDQPAASLTALTARIAAHSSPELSALHDLVTIPGSLVIGLAISAGRLTAEQGFSLSRLDEDWQAEHWGRDDEAEDMAARRRAQMLVAGRFLALCRIQDC